jgi:eukaryotic-like serine/threonine-protein kinase
MSKAKFLPALLGIFFISCSGVKLSQKIEIAEGDWLMAGGSPGQKNISYYELTPPLEKLWERDIEAGVGYSGIAVSDAVIFVNSLAGEMVSIDVSSGGKIGTLGFLGKDASSTPILFGNDVFVTYAGDDKYSAALYNISEGERKWRKNYGYIQTSPVLYEGNIYFGTLKGTLNKIDPDSGNLVWKFYSGEPIHSTCAINNNRIFFGTDKGSICCIKTDDGLEAWSIKAGAPVYSTPLAADEKVYLGTDDSNFYAINAIDGSIAWSRNFSSKIVGGSTLYDDNTIIFGTISGMLYALNINSGETKWAYKTNGTITSSPLTSGKYVYCTSFDSYVYCLDGRTGMVVWKYMMENKSRTTPIVWKDYLFVAADRSIYCFTNKKIEIGKDNSR